MRFGTRFLTIVVFSAWFFTLTMAATEDEAAVLRQKITDRQTAVKKLEAEIKQYNQELGKASEQSQDLSTEIKRLDTERKKMAAQISLTENKIEDANLRIAQLKLAIADKSESIDEHQEAIREALQKMRSGEMLSWAEMLLAGDSWSKMLINISSFGKFEEAAVEKTKELAKVKSELTVVELKTNQTKTELVRYRDELADERKIADNHRETTNRLLAETQNKEANYRRLLAARRAKKEAFEKELFEFESQLKFVLDPSKIPPVGKGILAWPLDQITVTQYFGVTSDSRRLYASGSHNGVDFRASQGTRVKAVAGGEVLGTGDTDTVCPGASYGKWILIKHSNGLASVYGHLSLIKVVKGEKVAVGQVIGYSGNTGYSTGPHLHLSIFAAEAVEIVEKQSKVCGGVYILPIAAPSGYLDPLAYL